MKTAKRYFVVLPDSDGTWVDDKDMTDIDWECIDPDIPWEYI